MTLYMYSVSLLRQILFDLKDRHTEYMESNEEVFTHENVLYSIIYCIINKSNVFCTHIYILF